MSSAQADWEYDERQEQARCATAAWCCAACGAKYGEARDGQHTYHNGSCDVCCMEAGVCAVRDWGWLRKREGEVG